MNPTVSEPLSETKRMLFERLWENEGEHQRNPQTWELPFRPAELADEDTFLRYRAYSSKVLAAPLHRRQLNYRFKSQEL